MAYEIRVNDTYIAIEADLNDAKRRGQAAGEAGMKVCLTSMDGGQCRQWHYDHALAAEEDADPWLYRG